MRAGYVTDLDDVVLGEVSGDGRLSLSDHVGLVGFVAVRREAVLVRVDGDGRHAQLMGGTEHADRDFLFMFKFDARGRGYRLPAKGAVRMELERIAQ